MIISDSNGNNIIPKEIISQKIFPYLDIETIFSLPRISKSYKEFYDKIMKGLWSRQVKYFPFTNSERTLNPGIDFWRFGARLDRLVGLKASIRERDGNAREGKIEGSILSWDTIPKMSCVEYEKDSENLDQVITGELKEAYLKTLWIRNLGMSALGEIPNFFIGMLISNLSAAMVIAFKHSHEPKEVLINFVLPGILGFSALIGMITYSSLLIREMNLQNIVKMREVGFALVLGWAMTLSTILLLEFGSDLGFFVFAGINFMMGLLCGPVEVDVKQKMVSIAKGGIGVIKWVLKNILKKVWEYRTAILSLAVLSTFCYYNTTADALVAPIYRPVMDLFADLGNKMGFVREILIEALELKGLEKTLLLTSLSSYVIGYLSTSIMLGIVGKAYRLIEILSIIGISFVNCGIKGGNLMVNICVNILKKMFEQRNEILALLFLGMVCYYNPTANALVAPCFRAMMESLDSILARVEGAMPGSVNNIAEMHAYLIELSNRGGVHFESGMQVLKVLLENMVSSITDLGRAS